MATEKSCDILWAKVVKQDGCFVCGHRKNLHAHHLAGRGRSIRHKLENGVALCQYHHQEWECAPHVSAENWQAYLAEKAPEKLQWFIDHRHKADGGYYPDYQEILDILKQAMKENA